MAVNHVPVSLCMILKNSEDGIRRCLDSARGLYDELVVVMDASSTDDTERIVREEYGAKVATREWAGFATQRNESIRMASHPWCLVLDGDEWVHDPGNLRDEIDAAHEAKYDAVFVSVQAVDGNERPREDEKQFRAFRRDRCRYVFPVHNQLRGWRRGKISESTARFVAKYAGDLRERARRAEGPLLDLLDKSEPGTPAWEHALCFLARTYAMVNEHEKTVRYARPLLEHAPAHVGYSGIWPQYVRAVIYAESPERAREELARALSHHPQMPDLWWWSMFLSAAAWVGCCETRGPYDYVPQISRKYLPNVEVAGPMLGWPIGKREAVA